MDLDGLSYIFIRCATERHKRVLKDLINDERGTEIYNYYDRQFDADCMIMTEV